MNYRHAFHAGNYADVFKHVLLLQLVRALQRKETGFLFLDTHAGRGGYDLTAPPDPRRADRAPEWPEGIGRLAKLPAGTLPPPLADYLGLVREFNRRQGVGAGGLRYYPGSPWLAALARRPQDRLALWEKHPIEARALRKAFGRMRQVAVESGDGYRAPAAVLPPPERRALVLIDPPFEEPGEFAAIGRALAVALERLPGGVVAVWYPVTERAGVAAFHQTVRRLPAASLGVELAVTDDPAVRLKGCGLVVLNPPWQIAVEIEALLPALARILGANSQASAHLEWLVPEA
jgi:23S rRNA (adenine2030-N6)-methyltransferase